MIDEALVCSVHVCLLVTSAPRPEVEERQPPTKEIRPVARAIAAAELKAEPVAAAELVPADPEPVRTAAIELASVMTEEPAGPLAEAKTQDAGELSEAASAEPDFVEAERGHTFLSEPIEPDDTAAMPRPDRVAEAEAETEDLPPAEQHDAIAALIEATDKPVAKAALVHFAQAASPGAVPVFDAVDAQGATDDGKAEAAKAATLSVPEPPAPPLPVRKPVVKPAPETPAPTVPQLVAEAAELPQVVVPQSAPNKPNWQPMSLGFAKEKQASPQASATSAPAPKPISSGTYRAKVWASLSRHRPRLGKAGSATVTFNIGPNGARRGARVSRSSGDSALDASALAAVRGAAPFPAPPSGLSGSALTYSIQIYFR